MRKIIMSFVCGLSLFISAVLLANTCEGRLDKSGTIYATLPSGERFNFCFDPNGSSSLVIDLLRGNLHDCFGSHLAIVGLKADAIKAKGHEVAVSLREVNMHDRHHGVMLGSIVNDSGKSPGTKAETCTFKIWLN